MGQGVGRGLDGSPKAILLRCGPDMGKRINDEARRLRVSQQELLRRIVRTYFAASSSPDSTPNAFDSMVEEFMKQESDRV